MTDMKKILKMMFYENEELSLTRVISAGGYLLFAFVSVYLVMHQQKWDNYETFAIFSGGGGAATQVANKFVNGKYNSLPGSYKTSSLIGDTVASIVPASSIDHK